LESRERRRARPSAPILALALLALLPAALAGCDDGTDPVNSRIRGTVLDAQGDPLAGAAVLISYRPTFAPYLVPAKPQTRILFDLPEGTVEAIWLEDYCGQRIRTVCDGDCGGAGSMAIWDGRNDEGRRVVDGVYFASVQTADSLLVHDLVLISEYEDWDPDTDEAHAFTDALGRFEIPQRCLPFGHVTEARDEYGEIEDSIEVARWIELVAVHPGGGQARSDSVYVDARRGASAEVSFAP
jgi:hypothetical protein